MTFDELITNHTHHSAVQGTMEEGTRLGILDWEIVNVSPYLKKPCWWKNDPKAATIYFAVDDAIEPIKDWLNQNVPEDDWALIRAPYYVAFRNTIDATMFLLSWGGEDCL